ncbi:MAG: DUF3014 domain-containing protein [Gammaproteobacteria bacterium]|nr:DUF3014 domain-containing protein [Gammaproteobacteria bacterium]MBU1443012.1 DUF3014 domain-containing protein [Gammaproteobacteria bacterium]MBU2286972.1 DUF3014 domain-containing protein [Gammaproteobacteria bacterium]
MAERDRAVRRSSRESSLWIVVVLVILALVAGGFWWRWSQEQAQTPPPGPSAGVPQPDFPPAPPELPAAAAPAGPQFPVDTAADAKLPSLGESDGQIKSDLDNAFGSKGVLTFLQIDGFVRRMVATVDNLTREQAPSRVWPVQPAPDRFKVAGEGAARTIDADNAARYTPFVLFVESVDAKKASALYTKLYPLFQQAYEELGYPGRYFNDRLIAVIDHLLQAPEPTGPVQVKLTEVKSDVSAQRPWVRYEFVDPNLETLSAGQKIMVRVGLVNERRLKAKLSELRALLARGAAAKK